MRTKAKITALKRMVNQRVRDQYLDESVKERMAERPCSQFSEGQEFVLENLSKPDGFCTWAWNDIFPRFQILRSGGRFGGWSKNENALIRCCTSGVRPVVFNLEWIDD